MAQIVAKMYALHRGLIDVFYIYDRNSSDESP